MLRWRCRRRRRWPRRERCVACCTSSIRSRWCLHAGLDGGCRRLRTSTWRRSRRTRVCARRCTLTSRLCTGTLCFVDNRLHGSGCGPSKHAGGVEVRGQCLEWDLHGDATSCMRRRRSPMHAANVRGRPSCVAMRVHECQSFGERGTHLLAQECADCVPFAA